MKVLTKEELITNIEAAEAKYYKENPCFHCGPGNGCDDCRGCEDAKKSWELGNELSKAKKEYEQRFGHSYAQDCDYEQIVKKEEEYNKCVDHCRKCGGNFDDDCRDCGDWDKKFQAYNSLKWLKEEFKRNYHIDYDKINKENIMKTDKKDDFIISAEEARKMTQKEKEQDNKCLEPIMEKIKEAIKKKDNYCYIGIVEEYVLDKLRKLGYTVSGIIKGDRSFDPDVRKISW